MMISATREPPKRRCLPEIYVDRPRCPNCASARLKKHRSLADCGDGSAVWWVQCECGHRFRVVLK